MNSIRYYLTAFATGLLVCGLASCGTPPAGREPTIPAIPQPSVSSPSISPSQAPSATPSPKITQPASTANTVTVNIYQVDSQCQVLIPMRVNLPVENSLETAVTKVLEQQYTSDFNLSYRVSLDAENAIVTIDFRVPAGAKRTLTSLSSCEQLALFGSLRQTLTSNRTWKIKNVRFTEQGAEIWL